MAALKFLAIVPLLLIISPCHEMNMTHTIKPKSQTPRVYHAEVKQPAFNPGNMVPGIGLSADKMLQGRLFSCGDAQHYHFSHCLKAEAM
ncbi:MAG: catalase [Thiotrichaceae bacterium]|nr:catalase [Thiotrichaceae bacterium]